MSSLTKTMHKSIIEAMKIICPSCGSATSFNPEFVTKEGILQDKSTEEYTVRGKVSVTLIQEPYEYRVAQYGILWCGACRGNIVVEKGEFAQKDDWQVVYPIAHKVASEEILIRVRITPPSDSRKLYRQRVASPGPESDFSQWTYTSQYDAVIVAAASLGAEVSIFWIKSDHKIQRLKSTDYGVSWSSPELIDYSPTTAINGITAAYKPNGDLALFFADQQTLYVKKYENSQWQTKSAWDKSTGVLSGVAAVYDGDWNLFVTGQDTGGNFKLWSLVYGDGGDVAAGTWSELEEFA